MSAEKYLTEVFDRAKKVPFDDSDKFILFSDCHRGDNSWADEFTNNHNLFLYALQHYHSEGFTYIEVGDGDELWENAFEDIRKAHNPVFRQMMKFYDKNPEKNRLYLIWGNHDIERQGKKIVVKTLYGYDDRRTKKYELLFDGIEVYEGLILKQPEREIFVVHGHQVDPANYMWYSIPFWRVNRYFHRNLWKYAQLVGLRNPLSPTRRFNRIRKIDEKLTAWAKNNKRTLIAGHTHYYIADPPYFNIGCCVYPHRITGIEIEKGHISLIEWSTKINPKDRTLFAHKEVLSQPYLVGPMTSIKKS